MYELLTKLPFNRGLKITTIIAGIFIAPYWFLYNFCPLMITDIDFIPSVILTLAISLPPTYIHYITMLYGYKLPKGKEIKILEFNLSLISFLYIFIGLIFYLPCILLFFQPISKNAAVYNIILMNSSLTGGIIAMRVYKKISRVVRYSRIIVIRSKKQ